MYVCMYLLCLLIRDNTRRCHESTVFAGAFIVACNSKIKCCVLPRRCDTRVRCEGLLYREAETRFLCKVLRFV